MPIYQSKGKKENLPALSCRKGGEGSEEVSCLLLLDVLLVKDSVVTEPVKGNLVSADFLVAIAAPAEGVVEEDADAAVLVSSDDILTRIRELGLKLSDIHALEAAVLVSLLDGEVDVVLLRILNLVGDVEGGADKRIAELADTVAVLLGILDELADNLLG